AGSGLSTFLRTLGASFAVSITSFLWDRRAVVHHAQLSEHVSAFDPAVRAEVARLGGGDPQRAAALLGNLVDAQAYQISFNDVSFALGCVYLAVMAVVWLARPPF
ncbi:MFS transporter, partial [Paraburkholderia sp. SIMBA_050]